MAQFFLQLKGPRPDFRLVVTFLWGDFHNVDTEGDSHNPASRDWTHLYCQNRERGIEIFEVGPVEDSPLILEVQSEIPELAARVAYFLASETHAQVASDDNGPWYDSSWLLGRLGSFDVAAAERRSKSSIWRHATLQNPYP